MDNFMVYVIVAKNLEGKPRGLEKSTGTFYFTDKQAGEALDSMELKEHFMVCPVIVRPATEEEIRMTQWIAM
jgi:hypothetical protein